MQTCPRRAFSLAGSLLLAALVVWGCGQGGDDGDSGAGSLAWATRAGGSYEDLSSGVAAFSDDSVVVTGCLGGPATFGQGEPNETSLTCAGYYDIFVARFNADGTLAWAKGVGGTSDDRAYNAAVLADDSVVVTGYFEDVVVFGEGEANETRLTSVGHYDIFIARYDADGTLAWARRAGGTFEDAGYDVAALADGSAVVTGEFWNTATFGSGESNETSLTSAGDNDIFVARFDTDGTLAWARCAGSVGFDWGAGTAALSDDSVVVTGPFQGTATFGGGESNEAHLTSAGDFDIFVARYDVAGSLAWAKRAGDTHYDYGGRVAALSDDSVVLTGGFVGSCRLGQGEPGETTLISAGDPDIFVARYNPDGTLSWAGRAGGVLWDTGLTVAARSDDSVVVVGFFQDIASFGPGEASETSLTSAGSEDAFIACYAADGTLAWARRAGGPEDDGGAGGAALSDDSVVVTGSFAGALTFGPGPSSKAALTSAGFHDVFLVRFNP